MGYLMIENTAIKSITIPKNVKYCSIYNGSGTSGPLANSKYLTTVIFEDGMTEIPDNICSMGVVQIILRI